MVPAASIDAARGSRSHPSVIRGVPGGRAESIAPGQIADLDATAVRLEGLGFTVDRTEQATFPGHRRVHAFDGHGNRIELLAVL